MGPVDLSQLFEARRGLPNEKEAVSRIATFAVIPAAMGGLLAGMRFVGLADPLGRLAWVCTGSAAAAGFAAALLVLAIHRLFGFRPVAVVADMVAGILFGLFVGGALTMLLLWGHVFPPGRAGHAFWPFVLIPLGAVAMPVARVWLESRPGPAAAAEDGGESAAAEPEDPPPA